MALQNLDIIILLVLIGLGLIMTYLGKGNKFFLMISASYGILMLAYVGSTSSGIQLSENGVAVQTYPLLPFLFVELILTVILPLIQIFRSRSY